MLGTQEQGSRFFLPLMGLPPFPWGVPAGVPKCGAAPGNLFQDFVPEHIFIGNTPSEQRRTAAHRGGCAPCSPPVSSPAAPGCPSAHCCRCGAGWPVPCRSTRTRSPYWTRRPFLLQAAEVGAGEEVAAFEEVHLRPAFRQQGVQVLPHQPLALIGLHGFPLLIFGQRVHFGREVELLTLPHIHEGLRPDLEDLLVGQVPGLLLPAAGGLDRPEAAVAGGVPQIAGLGVGGTEEHALTQMGRLPKAAR